MLWPLAYDVKFTVIALIAFIVLATCMAPRRHFKRKEAFVLSVFFSILLCAPVFIGVTIVLDQFRFGTRHYDEYEDISFLYTPAHHRIPKEATDITIEQGHNGFEATYKIEKLALQEFVDQFWDTFGQHSIERRENRGPYDGPVESDYGNFTITYDESTGIARQEASIW